MQKNLLRSILDSESRAYGFTIAFWGSGIVLIKAFGVPGIERVLFYALGAITGFMVTTLIAYHRFFQSPSYEQPEYLIFSTVHYLSSLAPIVATYGFTLLNLNASTTFFLSGVSVSLNYNILMLVEESISEHVKALEEKIF